LAWAKSQKKTQPQRGSLDQHSYCPDRIYRLGATLLVLMEVIRTYLVLTGKVPPNGFFPDNANLSPFMQRLAARTATVSKVCRCSAACWLCNPRE
jgi:hypothetical protein